MTLREQWVSYQARWRGLDPRERRVLAAGGLVAAVLLGYLLIWSPLSTSLHHLGQAVPRDRARLLEMRHEAQTVAQLRRQAPPTSHANLMSILEQSATQAALRQQIVRMEPSGAHGARVVFDHVDFNTLVGWLASLQLQGIAVRRAAIDHGQAPGQVSATLLLSEAGS